MRAIVFLFIQTPPPDTQGVAEAYKIQCGRLRAKPSPDPLCLKLGPGIKHASPLCSQGD